ncbi:protein kinase-like domain, concanavalin A-like lectin/glucanase domain protein [Tanacetum coccineum]
MRSAVVLTTLSITWKIPNEPLLIMHPHEPTRWEVGSSLRTKDEETLMKPPILGKESQTLTRHMPRRLPAHGMAHSLPTHLEDEAKEEGNVKTRLLKKPRPPWVKIKIMSKRLGPRRKPSNPGKICNFVGRVKGLKVFVRNFNYECDFMVLEDTTSVTDHDLGSVILGKPFVEATGLVYDREEGTITFEKDKEKIVFKMPHKMEMFKHIDFKDIKTDHIPPFAIESNDDNNRKTHYSDSLDLGLEYKHDENMCRAIRRLIAIKAKRNKREVM